MIMDLHVEFLYLIIALGTNGINKSKACNT